MTENINTKIEVEYLNEDESYGKFVIMPLERGYGTTLGNSLRRVLLSSLPGAAISKINIQDVLHEFSTIKGVKEDVPEIILNLKGIAMKKYNEEPVDITVDIDGPAVVTASDIIIDTELEVANPDHFICTLDDSANLRMSLRVENGKGYRLSEFNKAEDDQIGDIAIDSLFSPVQKVNFSVDNTRVGQVIDYDKLTLEVWTDGTITAGKAISDGSKILIDYLELFRELPNYELEEENTQDETTPNKEEYYSVNIEDLDLTLRSFNCLKRANINTVGDIVSKTRSEMEKIKNFGKKSLEEVEEKIYNMGLTFLDESTEDME